MNEHYRSNLDDLKAMAEALAPTVESLKVWADHAKAMRDLSAVIREKPDDEEGAVGSLG